MSLEEPDEAGKLLQQLVNDISHRGGLTLSLMNDAAVTLHQVLLLTHLTEAKECAVSDLAARLNMSPPSISQMVDRLFQLGMISRAEDAADRRRKILAVTPKAKALLARISAARSAEYAAGLASVRPALRKELVELLRKVLKDLHSAPNGRR
jgi:DNA-binding MarR family transcriptional regulator